MLETLRIENYALIDRLETEFAPGFNAITGETGAGKSILIGALGLVLGARASADMVREGAESARVEALFRVAKPSKALAALLREQEIPLEDDGGLLLCRTVSADGRGRAHAGGRLVPVSVLAAIGDELVDLHGQHDHQSLLRADQQRLLLDEYAGAADDAARVAALAAELGGIGREIATLETDDRERARRMEFLRFEVDEIDAAGLRPGEEEEVRARHRRITHAETLHTLANRAHALLYDGDTGAAIDAIDAAAADLEEMAGIDGEFRALAGQLAEARAQVDAVAAEVRRHTGEFEFDPEELEELNRRIALLGALKRKYGPDVEAVLAYRERAAAELAGYENRDGRLAELRREEACVRAAAEAAAEALSKKRRAAAAKLAKQIPAELHGLEMRGARFEVEFTRVDLCAHGIDRIEFLLSANAGEKPKPLRQVASGGEISRVMLAMKCVFAGADRIPVMIFDEIDAGVGGAAARRVAEKMAELAETRQVLCITHLAQIAAAAAAHHTVRKQAAGGHTATTAARVLGGEREREVARLLDGSEARASIEHARALLDEMTRRNR